MVIETLKDIKIALASVPDELLDKLCFGLGESAEETIQLITTDEEFTQVFEEIENKYPQVNEVVKLIENFAKAKEILEDQENTTFQDKLWEQPLTSDYFKDEVKSSPSQKDKLGEIKNEM